MMDIEAEKNRVREFVDKGNYHAAINIAISALNECRRRGDPSGVNQFLDLIEDVVQTMRSEFGSSQ